MAFDGIVLHAVIDELGGLLAGGRVEKIFQTGAYEITLLVHAGGEHYRLLLSADPAAPRMHLTRSKKENPALPPPFCMVLRKYLTGSRILSVKQQGFDRVAVLEFETRNEMGDNVVKRLILEIMNRQSNIILVSAAGIIHDAVRHADSSVNRFREVMPARPYVLPPAQDKLAPDGLDEAAIRVILTPDAADGTGDDALHGQNVSKRLLGAISGFSPLLCDSVCRTAGIDPKTPLGALGEAEREAICRELYATVREIAEGRWKAAILEGERDFHCLRVCADACGVQHGFSTVNLAADRFYTARDEEQRFAREKAAVMRVVTGNADKLSKKLAEYRRSLEDAAGYERERQYGELLTAQLYALPETAERVTLTDYFAPDAPQLELELDASRSVADNAQLFFKRYRKHKAACENAGKLADKAQLELDYLDNVRAMLQNAASPEEVEDIRRELYDEEYYSADAATGRKVQAAPNAPVTAFLGGRPASKKALRERAKAAKGKAGKSAGKSAEKSGKGSVGKGSGNGSGGRNGAGDDPGTAATAGATQPVLRYSPGGFRILIGRNSRQNEKLTLRDAAPEDMWFHVKNAPGSHAVLKLKEAGRPAGDADLVAAAELAAYYSSQRGGSKVDVDYTLIKNVKKIPGGRPGMVTYNNFKTLTVAPSAGEADPDGSSEGRF